MNWKTIIQDLISSGMTQVEIGASPGVGLKQPAISALGDGSTSSPRGYEVCVALKKLHRKRVILPRQRAAKKAGK